MRPIDWMIISFRLRIFADKHYIKPRPLEMATARFMIHDPDAIDIGARSNIVSPLNNIQVV